MTKARFLNADDGRIVPKHCAAMRSHPSVTKCSVASRVTVLVFKCRNPLRYSSCWHSQALNVQEVASGRTAGSSMSNSITVRSIDPRDKSWLSRESRRVGVSMAELVRRMIRERRMETEHSQRPSEVFARHFGKDDGVELPPRASCSLRRLPSCQSFSADWKSCCRHCLLPAPNKMITATQSMPKQIQQP